MGAAVVLTSAGSPRLSRALTGWPRGGSCCGPWTDQTAQPHYRPIDWSPIPTGSTLAASRDISPLWKPITMP